MPTRCYRSTRLEVGIRACYPEQGSSTEWDCHLISNTHRRVTAHPLAPCLFKSLRVGNQVKTHSLCRVSSAKPDASAVPLLREAIVSGKSPVLFPKSTRNV